MKAKTYQAVKDALEIIIKQTCSETAVADERGLFDVKYSDKLYIIEKDVEDGLLRRSKQDVEDVVMKGREL